MTSEINDLCDSIQTRRRPEDVADLVLEVAGALFTASEKKVINQAAKLALRRQAQAYTSMLQDFRRPTKLDHSVKVARDLFATAPVLAPEDCGDPGRVLEFVQMIGPEIRKAYGASDFKANRLNRSERKKAGIGDLSRRKYNKRFRLLVRMERKIEKLAREVQKYEFTRISKSGLATHVAREELEKDVLTTCFIAYFSARRNMRSTFTWGKQERAYDEICEILYRKLCRQPEQTNWWAVAHVYQEQGVLGHLTDEQRGRMLGRWFRILQDIAGLLETTWNRSNIDRRTMIVRRGNDSSTWNATAGAWNKARDAWVQLVHSMGMSEMLDKICFGKVLRLMAADVAYMHENFGSGGLEPDTVVWNALPLPWEVVRGTEQCTRADVIAACESAGIDPATKGWISPRGKHVAQFKPTPELVHGVVVSNPDLATTLRKAGVFSGKGIRWEALDSEAIFDKSPTDDRMVVTPA